MAGARRPDGIDFVGNSKFSSFCQNPPPTATYRIYGICIPSLGGRRGADAIALKPVWPSPRPATRSPPTPTLAPTELSFQFIAGHWVIESALDRPSSPLSGAARHRHAQR